MAAMMHSELRAEFPNKRIMVADASPDSEISRRLRYANVGPAPFDFFRGLPIEEVSECQTLIFQALGREGEDSCLANLLDKYRPRLDFQKKCWLSNFLHRHNIASST